MNSLILAQLLLVYRRKGIDFSGFKMQQHLVCVCVLHGEGIKDNEQRRVVMLCFIRFLI